MIGSHSQNFRFSWSGMNSRNCIINLWPVDCCGLRLNLQYLQGITISYILRMRTFKKIFLMWIIFKVFIEFITILLLFYVNIFYKLYLQFLVFWLQGMWDLSSLTRDWTRIDHGCVSTLEGELLTSGPRQKSWGWGLDGQFNAKHPAQYPVLAHIP